MRARIRFPAFLLAAWVAFSVPARSEPEAPPVSVESRVEAVTVYLDRAIVSRKGRLDAKPGRVSAVFQNLPAELDDGSLRLALSGPARLEAIQSRRTFLGQPREEAVRKLEGEIRALSERIQEHKDILDALGSAVSFLSSVQVARADRLAKELGRETGEGPKVSDYKEVLAFVTDGRIETAARIRRSRAELQDLEPELSAKRRELSEMQSAARLEQKEVTVLLSVREAAPVELTLSYMMPGALWYPAYDVRVDRKEGSAEVSCYAVIQQATGEDWNGATLALSAAQPAVRVIPPKPRPWFMALDGPTKQASENDAQTASWNPMANLNLQYLTRHAAQKAAHQQLLENEMEIRRVFESVTARSSSALFTVAGRESVRSDGRPHRVTLGVFRLPVAQSYEAVPKQSLNIYTIGRMANGTDLPFLPGKAQIFIGPDLIGTSSMDFVAPGETASVYLGIDERVKVTRELDSKNSAKTFFSNRKRLEIAYVITVENFRAGPAEVSLYESLPVSQDERIRVRIGTIDPKPQEQERGIARWDLRLAAGEIRTIRFAYDLEYPEGAASPEVAAFERQVRMKK